MWEVRVLQNDIITYDMYTVQLSHYLVKYGCCYPVYLSKQYNMVYTNG